RPRLFGATSDVTTYQYNALNRLTSAAYGSGSLAYTYAPNGARATESGTDPVSGAAVNRRFAYNDQNELASITNVADPTSSVAFSYDANGNTTGEAVGTIDANGVIASPRSVRTFAYDIRDHLLTAQAAEGSMTYDYDFAGRRVKAIGPFGQLRFLPDSNS